MVSGVKFNVSLSIDPDLHSLATEYAQGKKISFSRLVQESLIAVLGRNEAIDGDLRAQVENRIVSYPGRKPLTEAEKAEREAEKERIRAQKKLERAQRQLAKVREKYPDARLSEPRAEDGDVVRDGRWGKDNE